MLKKLIFLYAISLLVTACKHSDGPRWDTQILAPLARTELSLADIVADTHVVVNPDQSVKLVQDQELAEITIDTLVSISTEPFLKVAKLSSLTLTPAPITRAISLGEIANQMIAQGGTNALIGYQIISSNGTFALVPGLNNLTAGPFDIDITSFFLTATFLSGDMTVTISNGLPLTITHASFQIKNKSNGVVFANPDFVNVATGQSQSQVTDLSGQTVDGIVQASATDLDLAAGFVLIDTSAKLLITMSLNNVALSSATAIFPAQDVANESAETWLEGMGDVELTQAEIASGQLIAEVVSTVQDSVFFTYTIVSATKNGVIFNATRSVPPAPSGGNITREFTFDLSDYSLDLTGDPARVIDTVNTFYSSFVGRIKYTGNITTLTLTDSVMFYIRTENLKPTYVKGYLGRDTVSKSGIQTLDFFRNIRSGTLNFESVVLKLDINNGMGVPGQLNVTEVKGINTRTGQEQTLNIPTQNAIAPATDMPLTPTTTTIDLSNDASTVAFMNILPDRIIYDVDLISNPQGNTHTYTDFAYNTSSYSARMYLEVPLSIIATDLVLQDTGTFNSSILQQQSVTEGRINVIAENGFPLDAQLWLYLMDANGNITDSLTSNTIIQAAPVNASNVVVATETTVVPYLLPAETMQKIYSTAQIVFKAKFNTAPGAPNFIKLYTDYKIKFKITGDVNYEVR